MAYTIEPALEISSGEQSDIDCLKSIKHSLKDPYDYLNTSRNFSNYTKGFICKFTGVECWHPDENRVLNLRLSDMGLSHVVEEERDKQN